MRAAAYNPISSPPGRHSRWGCMLALGWGLAAAIGAVAGMMIAPVVFLDPNMMTGDAALCFRRRPARRHHQSARRRASAASLVGVIENIGGAYIVGTELKLSLALAIIVCRPGAEVPPACSAASVVNRV